MVKPIQWVPARIFGNVRKQFLFLFEKHNAERTRLWRTRSKKAA